MAEMSRCIRCAEQLQLHAIEAGPFMHVEAWSLMFCRGGNSNGDLAPELGLPSQQLHDGTDKSMQGRAICIHEADPFD